MNSPATPYKLPANRGRVAPAVGVGAFVALLTALGAVLILVRPQPIGGTPVAAPAPATTSAAPAPTTSAAATTTAPPAPKPGVEPEALPALLPDGVELSSLTGVPNFTQAGEGASPYRGGAVDPGECAGINDAAWQQTYTGSRYVGIYSRLFLDGSDQTFQNSVLAAVADFTTSADARHMVDMQAQRWNACANRSYTVTFDDGSTSRMSVGEPYQAGTSLVVTLRGDDVAGWTCEHSLRAADTVVIDVMTCSFQSISSVRIADRIASRITPA